MAASDTELIMQAQAGSDAAAEELLERHGGIVRARIATKIGQVWKSSIDEDDVMQVTYLEAFLRLESFEDRGDGSFLAWLSQIAENNLRDAIRGLERAKRPDPRKRVEARSAEQSYVGLVEVIGVTYSTPSMAAATREVIGELDRALSRLPEHYERVIRLYDLEQLDIGEVAQRLGKSPGAVYMLRSRAHEQLAEVLGRESKFFSRRS
ncbi:MAG: RNA polymerase sigma factor [Phycisphaerales bacterium JB037]